MEKYIQKTLRLLTWHVEKISIFQLISFPINLHFSNKAHPISVWCQSLSLDLEAAPEATGKATSEYVQIFTEGPGFPVGPGLEDEATAQDPSLPAWGPES